MDQNVRQRITAVRVIGRYRIANSRKSSAAVFVINNIFVPFHNALSIRIILIKDVCIVIGLSVHLRQLPSVLPHVRPCTVVGQVADGIAGQRLSIVASQQILPSGIVAVGDGIQRRAQRAGGVGVLGLTEDIAAVVVGVDPCLTRRLIVLAGQLIKVIVDVGGGVRAVSDGGDVAADIVGVGIGLTACRPLVDLCAGGSAGGVLIGDGSGDNGGRAALGGKARHAAVGIVGVVCTGEEWHTSPCAIPLGSYLGFHSVISKSSLSPSTVIEYFSSSESTHA